MDSDNLIKVEQLSRWYGPLRAVDDISFEVRRGEVLGFLGPNGAGKSTTMQILSGNLAPSAGRVLITGKDILDEPEAAKAALGYLPEQPPLYRELTVDEYLGYCARLNRIPREQRRGAVDRAKERCGLTEVGRRLIGNLSKGYQQRTGIAQAIIHSPAVVILDEPTVGLDPIQIREIRALIRELGGEHSVILSTHILPEVQAVCDRVQIIHRGHLVFSDTIDSLTRQQTVSSLRAGFRNPPPAAELARLPGVLEVEELGAGLVRLRFDPERDITDALLGRAMEAGWRPYELTPEIKTLEQIFVDITSRDTGTPHAVAEPQAQGEAA
ncbi:MAG: ATP-binding cassette domain-containing protein [Gammaproteobacteria bacterium]|nr:ATP-binding cassette domain-containing protein [Gammaproteobacteria bacterium]